jgi:hypothetical protein
MLVSDPLVVEELADMHLCFLDGRLQVSDKFAGCASVFDRVMFCILSVMNFTKFSEGRWLSIGKSCRAAVGARLLGLDDLVSRVMEDPCESTYYIHGWQGLDNSCREYMIIESLSSHLGESLHYALIDDNRVLQQLDKLKQLAAEEMQWLCDVGDSIWDALATLCEAPSSQLRDLTLRAAHVAHGFVRMRIFDVAESPPYDIALGDIDANMRRLKDGAEPNTHPVTWKIWKLMQLDSNHNEIRAGINLMRELPWGTKPAEEQHASVSLMARHHPDYEQSSLQHRAALHTLRKILPAETADEVRAKRLGAQLSRLESRRPHAIGARQAFCKGLIDLAVSSDKYAAAPKNVVSKKIIKNHGPAFAAMSKEREALFARRALALASEKKAAIDDAIETKTLDIALLRSRIEAHNLSMPDIRFSSSRLSDEELEDWAALFKTTSFVNDTLPLLRRPCGAPSAPDADYLAQLATVPLQSSAAATAYPPWMAKVVHNREMFNGSVWVFRGVFGKQAFAFLYAMQVPYYIQFAPIDIVDDYVEMGPIGAHNWEDHELNAAVQSFRLKLGAFLSWEGLPRLGPENIQIAFNVRFRRGLEMTSTSLLEPFTDVLAYLATPTRPATTANPGSSGEPRQPSWKQLVLERFPWMQGALEGGNRRGRPGDRAGGQPNDRNIDESANDPEPLDDELIEEAFAMLEAKRAELASTDDIEITDFTTGLLGGTWTMAHSGKAFDAYQSKIRGGSDAIEWCNQYNCTKSARFDISLYGDAQASLMAREWARRLQYFFNIYTSSGDAHYVFSDDDVKSYVPTVGFLELERDFNARALVRWRWLACFVPKK